MRVAEGILDRGGMTFPCTRPLYWQVGMGAETEWLRAEELEGMSESGKGTHPHGRPGLG